MNQYAINVIEAELHRVRRRLEDEKVSLEETLSRVEEHRERVQHFENTVTNLLDAMDVLEGNYEY